MRTTEQVKNWLATGRAHWILIALGTLLVVPCIDDRLVLDDHLHALMLRPLSNLAEVPHAPFDLFVFARPGALNDGLLEHGILLPWWTDRQLLIAFFRPLSCLTHALDAWLWPRSPVMMHVQSLLWYALLLVVVSVVYRRLVEPAWLSGGALALYAVDDTHGATLAWIANRNAILATIFGLCALVAHDRHRRDGWRWGPLAGLSALTLGLLSGEAAVATGAYLVAYALFLDKAPLRARVVSLLPYLFLVVVWRVAYQCLGYGATGSGVYIDPAREAASFFARLPQFSAVLLQGQFGFPGADLWFWGSVDARPRLVLLAFATCAVGVAILAPLLRRDAKARFWGVSLLASIIPCTSSVPGDRLLLFSGVAGMALLAQLLAAFFDEAAGFVRRGPWRSALTIPVLALVARRLVLAPILLPIRAHSMAPLAALSEEASDAVAGSRDVNQRSLVVVNPPTSALASYLLLILATRGEPAPDRVRWLATADSDLELTRVSERVLRVRPAGGWMRSWPDQLYRSASNPIRLGEPIRLSDVTITVTALEPDGRPAQADFEFRDPLESPVYLWMSWEDGRLQPFSPPAVGHSSVLPAIDFVELMAGRL